MSSTPMYHPADDETNPHPEDQGVASSHQQNSEDQAESTDLDELNDDGVGGTLGAKDTFEPEESEESPGTGSGDSSQE